MKKTINKALEYYMSLPYTLEIIPDIEEGGYGARYPELPGCITCSDTLEGIVRNAEDAKKAWLEAAIEDDIPIPEPISEAEMEELADIPSQYKLRIPKTLYRSLKYHAEVEGVSMNQYCNYLLSMNDSIYGIKRATTAG